MKYLKYIVAFVISVGIVGTIILAKNGTESVKKLKSAREINESLSLNDFLEQRDGDYAYYIGDIKAEFPVTMNGLDKRCIYIHKEVERKYETYDDESDSWKTDWQTVDTQTEQCKYIILDNTLVERSKFKSLPTYSNSERQGDYKTTYTYTEDTVKGAFFIESKNGAVSSVKYYKSNDIEKEMQSGTMISIITLWIVVIIIGEVIYFVLEHTNSRW